MLNISMTSLTGEPLNRHCSLSTNANSVNQSAGHFSNGYHIESPSAKPDSAHDSYSQGS